MLAALVNIKQESVAFVAALALTVAALGLFDRRVGFWRALARFAPAFLPAAALYLLWRWFALDSFSSGAPAELKLLPLDQWHWDVLPQVFARIGEILVEKGVFFAIMLLALGLLVLRLRGRRFDLPSRLLALLAGFFALYNVFLLLTYVALFTHEASADAHSFFRYNTHLSLLLVRLGSELGHAPVRREHPGIDESGGADRFRGALALRSRDAAAAGACTRP